MKPSIIGSEKGGQRMAYKEKNEPKQTPQAMEHVSHKYHSPMSTEALHEAIGPDATKLLRSMGILETVEKMVMCMTTEEPCNVLPVATWTDASIEITLDSGCVEHVMDLDDAPGYEAYLVQSAGSKRGQQFVVGNGEKVPNEGEVRLQMEHNGVPIASTFQIAEVTRPLMSVGRVCDQGLECLFKRECAIVRTPEGKEVCRFNRVNGLYVASLTLKNPEGFGRPAP